MSEETNVDTSESPVESGESGNSISADIQAAFAQMSESEGDTPEPTEEPETETAESSDEPDPEPETPDEDEPPAETTEIASKRAKAPDHWSAEDKAAFEKATPEVQAWALKRDKQTTSDYTRKTQELAEQRKRFEALDSVLAQARETFNGVPDHEAVQWMANVHQFLRAEPHNAIAWLRQTYGIQDQQSTPATPTDESDADPVVSALKRELSDVKAQVVQFARETHAEKQTRIAKTIESFRGEKGPDGQPLRPHFEAVQGTMAQLVRSGIASDLHEAYQKAIALDPTVSALVREEESKRAKAAEAKRRAEEVAKAKRAGFRIPASPSGKQVQTNATLGDEIRAIAGGRKVIF